jgi:syntaxin-binding protein 5
MVRTITHEDVNVADAESLFSAGALDTQIRPAKTATLEVSHENIDGMPVLAETPVPPKAVDANRVPIFKLAWAGFPDQAALKLMMTVKEGEPLTNATVEYAERGETLLVILGGQSPNERPGINILQFPAFTPPIAARRGTTPMSPSQSMPVQERYAYRDSLMPTGSSNYPTRTPPEDFVLLPRSSPYYGLAHDPVALIVSLTPDKTLSSTDAPRAERGLDAWAFPPPRSTVIPPSPGRITCQLPGEDEKLVAMTPAPLVPSPGTPRTPGWRLPWTSPAPQSPSLRVPTPETSLKSPFVSVERRRERKKRRYRLPSALWSGNLSVLGCELHSLPTPTFKRLISHSIENEGVEDEPDATVRFWDISPHLLLLPTPLRFEYPGPLPHLTISVGDWLRSPEVQHLPIAKAWVKDRSGVKIKSVHLAREALECTVTFTSGELLVTKFGEGKGQAPAREEVEEEESYFPKVEMPKNEMASLKQDWVEEVTELGDLATWTSDGFKPVALFTLKRGEVLQCAVSDIGESLPYIC